MARLSNTASGAAGEAAVLALLLRAGLLVAKPYWGDDEMDLLVFVDNGTRLVLIPLQVKTVQSQSEVTEVAIQGLRKRYVERNKYLCLAIYSVERNKIWLIPTAKNIKEAYTQWASKPTKTKRRTQYDAIDSDNGEVNLRVNVSIAGDKAFDDKWLLDPNKCDSIVQRFNTVANEMQNDLPYQTAVGFKYIATGGFNIGGQAGVTQR
jgi:hypothetical protein